MKWAPVYLNNIVATAASFNNNYATYAIMNAIAVTRATCYRF